MATCSTVKAALEEATRTERSEPDIVEKGHEIVCEVLDGVAGRRLECVAVPSLRRYDGVDRRRKVIEDAYERTPRVRVRVQEHHRRAVGRALLGIGQLDRARE
jgi:hypothetical protein